MVGDPFSFFFKVQRTWYDAARLTRIGCNLGIFCSAAFLLDWITTAWISILGGKALAFKSLSSATLGDLFTFLLTTLTYTLETLIAILVAHRPFISCPLYYSHDFVFNSFVK